MRKQSIFLCLLLTLCMLFVSACGKDISDQASAGIDDESGFREYDTIDFDTVTIMEEEPPLGSSVNSDDPEELARLKNLATETFNLMNQERANAGLSPLTWDSTLELAAAVRAQECSTSFSHTRPNGSPWYTVNAQIMHGENLAFGYNSASDVMKAWMASPTHKENILYPTFTKVAIAIYTDGKKLYFAQEFRY